MSGKVEMKRNVRYIRNVEDGEELKNIRLDPRLLFICIFKFPVVKFGCFYLFKTMQLSSHLALSLAASVYGYLLKMLVSNISAIKTPYQITELLKFFINNM